MRSILDHCSGVDPREYAVGSTLIAEGTTSGQLFVLLEGQVEVLRGVTQVALVSEPGAVFGEMSILLGLAHTATVRVAIPSRVFVFDDAEAFLRSHPAIGFYLARLLAQRLNAATTYLVDLKRQFEGHSDHLGMVGDILESLMHQPDDVFRPAVGRSADPRL